MDNPEFISLRELAFVSCPPELFELIVDRVSRIEPLSHLALHETIGHYLAGTVDRDIRLTPPYAHLKVGEFRTLVQEDVERKPEEESMYEIKLAIDVPAFAEVSVRAACVEHALAQAEQVAKTLPEGFFVPDVHEWQERLRLIWIRDETGMELAESLTGTLIRNYRTDVEQRALDVVQETLAFFDLVETSDPAPLRQRLIEVKSELEALELGHENGQQLDWEQLMRADQPLDPTLEGQVIEVNLLDVLPDYEDPDDMPEWRWIESNASFAHRLNGQEAGVWEFMISLNRQLIDIPRRLRSIFRAAQERHARYILFHQG